MRAVTARLNYFSSNILTIREPVRCTKFSKKNCRLFEGQTQGYGWRENSLSIGWTCSLVLLLKRFSKRMTYPCKLFSSWQCFCSAIGPRGWYSWRVLFYSRSILPPNTALLLQPMDQQEIPNFKQLLTMHMFHRCFDVTQNTNINLCEFWKDHYNIVTCIRLLWLVAKL